MPGQLNHATLALAGAALVALGCLDLETSRKPARDLDAGAAGARFVTPAGPASGAAGAPSEPTTAPEGSAGSGAADEPESEAGAAGAAGALGTAGAGGAGGGEDEWASICLTKTGVAIPYDHSRGLAGEYAFELFMSCELGGYVTPLVEQDPELLTGVDAFAGALTDWLRHDVLVCAEASPPADGAVFLLLPAGAAGEVSHGDFRAAIQLLLRVLDRHDELEDGLDAATKKELRRRLETLAPAAVKRPTDTLSHPSSDPACLPAQDPAGEGGASNG